MPSSRIRVIQLIALSSFTCFGSESAKAAETNSLNLTMPAIVVTATRDARLIQETPYSTGSISANELKIEYAVRTVPEALKYEPGIMIQKTGHGQGSPYIRGFTSQRNLMMIDSIRLNNSVFREGPNQYWNTVDAMSLSRIEIARGPFSVLYGSDAIGGTVNAITRGVQDLNTDSNWDRNLYYRYGSAENSHIARAESIGKLTDNLVLSLGYTYKDFGNLEGGADVGTQQKTGYDEQDWDAKLEYFISEDSILVMAHQSVGIDDAWRTHKTIYGIDWEGLTVGNELRRVLDQNRDLTYLQYHQYNANGFAEEIHAGVSYHQQSEERDRLRTGDRHDIQGIDANTIGSFITLKSPTPFGTLIYGSEFYHDDVDSFKHTLNPDGSINSSAIQGPVGDDATYDTFGIYLQDEITLTKKLLVIIGARYEYAEADAKNVIDPLTAEQISVSGNWDDTVGSARLLYNLDQSWNIFAGVSQGFRAPNLSDLTRLDSTRTDEIETPSPNLDPEHFTSYEIGLKASTQKLTGQLACFYTDIDGMIVRTPTGRIIDGDTEVTKKNAGDGYIQGIELDARYQLTHDLAAFGIFTWMEGKVDTYPTADSALTREYIDRLMPPTGRFGLRWSHSKQWIEGSCAIAAKADKLSSRDQADTSRIPPGGTPAYTVYDLRSGYNFSKNITLSLAIENITNEDYRIHGSGVNEAGRNIVIAMQTKF